METLRRRSWPIRAKFFAMVVPLLVAVIAAVIFATHYNSYRQVRTEIEHKCEHLAVSQSLVLSRAMASPDPALLTMIAASLVVDRDVVFVSIEDGDGALLARVGEEEMIATERRRAIPRFGNIGNRPAGAIRIGMSYGRAEAELSSGWYQAALIAGIALLCLLLGGYLAFLWLISHPLDRLQTAIANWRAGTRATDPADLPDDELGRLARAFHELQDVRLAREEELEAIKRDLEGRVARRTADLSAARDAAEAADRSKASFLAAMSHEIRTPMNGILGMATSLATGAKDPEEQEKIETILASGRSLMELLNDILDLSKIDAGRMEIDTTEVDLGALIEQLRALWQPLALEKRVPIILDLPPDLPKRLVFDPIRVRQCVSNLLSNAVKFTEQGHISLTVTAAPADGYGAVRRRITVTVRDTGIGIPEGARASLFDPFTQADGSTTRRFGGTGLGLAITQRLSEMMGGGLSFESEEGLGSCFVFRFDAAVAKAPSQARRPLVEALPPAGPDLSGRKILVVDDVPTNRCVARLMIEPTGAEVIEAEDGCEALDRLAREPVDLVLLDLHMPVLDGIETIARIRQLDGPSADVPVMALTADVRAERRRELEALGVCAYVVKPIEIDLLLAALSDALAERGPFRPVGRVEAAQ